MNQESKRPVTLEDLLRLKRAERPSPEFWTTFDRELRAKQLAALVEKRPWWRTVNLSRAFRGFTRYYLPLGTAAIFAIVYVVVREGRTDMPHATVAPPAEHSVVAATVATSAPISSDTSTAAVVVAENVPAAPEVNADATSVESAAVLATDTSLINRDTPSARYIAANLRAAQDAESVITRGLLAQAHGFEARAVPAKPATVEPLAQMTSPNSARIAKLNTAMSAAMFVSDKSTITSDRMARRLLNESDDRLYEASSRIKASGNSMGLRF